MVLAFSASSISICLVSFAILALLFLIFHSRSLTLLSIFWYSCLHWSRLAMSAASSSFKVWIISLMATMTLSKWPTLAARTCTANAARRKLWAFLACAVRAAKARSGASDAALALPTCNKEMSRPLSYLSSVRTSLPALIAEAKSSRASSLVKISSACAIPAISSYRNMLRLVHSSCFAWQAALVWSKNSMSASFCARVSSYICCVSASRTSASAFSPSFFAMSACINFNSVVFTAMKSSNFVLAEASMRVAVSKSAAKVSYMSFKMPCTVNDWGMYFEP
mmetsp:Transcript_89264/g.257406  ORF Transcript_89264/g.257406 Transcript_89264/m.257406 type:complete len:280 (-) Transcript_89264:647-1486(-)